MAAAAVPAVLVPERRIWQVSRNAPVGSRIERGTSLSSFTDLFKKHYGPELRPLPSHAGYVVTFGDGTQQTVSYEDADRLGFSRPGWTFEPYEGPPVRNMYAELRRELQAPWDADLGRL